MIINTSFRGPGGLATHVQRTDTNEKIVVRDDLSLACSLEIDDAISDFAAIGAARGATKSIVHISASPELPLTAPQEQAVIDGVRGCYGLPRDHPVLVIMHHKPGEHNRPAHYHLVIPRVMATGTMVSDKVYKIRNERLSLELEHDLGHPLRPGPNLETVRTALERERPDVAKAIAELAPPPRSNDRATVNDKSFAVESGVDIAEFDRRVLDAWLAGDVSDRRRLEAKRLRLARGDKAIMIVDVDTGFAQSLQRALNRESKRRDQPLALKKADVDRTLSDITPSSSVTSIRRAVVSASAARMPEELVRAVAVERVVTAFDRFDLELALGPGGRAGSPKELKDDDPSSAKAKSPRPNTIAADLEVIRRHHQQIVVSRKRAAERAWRSARIWKSRSLQKTVALAAAGAAIATGGGLIMAVAAYQFSAGLAAGIGRRKLEAAKEQSAELRTSHAELKTEMDAYFSRVRAAKRFDLNTIPRHARVGAGAVFAAISRGVEPEPAVVEALDAAAPGLASQLADVARYSPSLGLVRVLDSMYSASDPGAARSLAAFVQRKGRPPATHAIPRSEQSRGRSYGD